VKRRDFIRATTAGVALYASGGLRAADGKMFVSLNGSLVGSKTGADGKRTPSVGWPEFARLAARVGYPGVDVNINAAMGEGEDATRKLFSELKIRGGVCGSPALFSRDEAAYKAASERLPDMAKFAAAIGCPRMMIVLSPSSETPKAELQKIFKDRLTAASEILLHSKVRLGMEFLGPMYMGKRQKYEFLWRMDEKVEFAKECGSNIGVVLDAWHWHHSGATIDDIMRAGKSRIVTVHVSDAKQQPPEEVRDNQRFLPGEGVINLVGFFQALKKIGYEDSVSPEPLGRIPSDTSPEEGARMGLESTLAVMRKAGVA
jgi:sugar phosphate isomerase/epimerase